MADKNRPLPVDAINQPIEPGALTPLQVAAVILKTHHMHWQNTPHFTLAAVKARHPGVPAGELASQQSFDFIQCSVAVALCESHGKVNAKGGPNSDGTFDWGLWQINDVHKKSFPGSWNDRFNPKTNTEMASDIFNDAKGFGPWSCWEAGYGPFQNYMGVAGECAGYVRLKGEVALGQAYAEAMGKLVPGGALIGAGAPAIDALKENPIGAVLSFAKDAGLVVGVFVVALILLALGLWAAIRETKAGTIIKNGNPLGRAISVAKSVK
jgi:hypothetical protein